MSLKLKLFVPMCLASCVILAAPYTAEAQNPIPGTADCDNAGLKFWKLGGERLEYYEDAWGRDVEVWCIRGVFNAHFDIRISWTVREDTGGIADGRPPNYYKVVKTVGGCYFDNGNNGGPDIVTGADKTFSTVGWTNIDPASKKEYKFSYDWLTGKLTITTTKPGGGPPNVQVVDPPNSYEDLAKLLPDPEIRSCTLESPTSAIRLSQTSYAFTVLVLDSLTGRPSPSINVTIRHSRQGWLVTKPTDGNGIVRLNVETGDYKVSSRAGTAFLSFGSEEQSITVTGSQGITLRLLTFGLPGGVVTAVILLLVLVAGTLTVASRMRQRTIAGSVPKP